MATASTSAEPVDLRLLTIAADQLRRNGARGVTVVGVAEAAGMTHANVYRYFPSQGGSDRRGRGAMAQGAQRRPSPRSRTRPTRPTTSSNGFILASAQAHRDLLARTGTCSTSMPEPQRAPAPSSASTGRGYATLIERVVDEGIATGLFDPRDRERALAFVTDAVYPLRQPVAVRARFRHACRRFVPARLAATIRAIQRVLTAGIL